MDATAQIRTVQKNLAEFAARLTALEAQPVPAEDRLKWHYLCQRHTLLRGLTEDTEHLAAAHEAADDPAAARAVSELTEHYRHQSTLARRDVALHKPLMARVINRSVPHQPW